MKHATRFTHNTAAAAAAVVTHFINKSVLSLNSCVIKRCYMSSDYSFSSTAIPPQEEQRSNFGGTTTHFGYKIVHEQEKQKMVFDVFANVANKYDIMNDLMSGTMHRLWKDQFIEDHYRPQPGCTFLDVAGGTGDIAFRIAEYLKRQIMIQQKPFNSNEEKSKIIVSDINPNMLQVGMNKASELGLDLLKDRCGIEMDWLEGNAESLDTVPSDSVDGYTIAFGIRNVTHIDRVLKEAHRILKRGGHFLCLEFSKVDNIALRQFYDWYSFNIIPAIGEVVANDRASYQYLVESIRQFPDQETFKKMIQDAGFKHAKYTSLTFGVVAVHSGIKL
jgi:2-methoxy-6-polyprenyl-1,4-benzoquinol methylase